MTYAVAMSGPRQHSFSYHARWVPFMAFVAMVVAIGCTPPRNPVPHTPPLGEVIAHHLGHEINSVWIGFGAILLVAPALMPSVRRRGAEATRWVWRVLDAIALDFLTVDALGKNLLPLPRPGASSNPGFPSGHATFGFLMAWLVWQRYPKLGPCWFGMAALIGWSRIENHAHYPYQVFAGALLGMALGALICGRETGVLVPRILFSDARLRAILNATNANLSHIPKIKTEVNPIIKSPAQPQIRG